MKRNPHPSPAQQTLFIGLLTTAMLLTSRTTCVAAEILFDNGFFSGDQIARYNSIVSNKPKKIFRIYDDFVLDQDAVVTGFFWKQHDYFDTIYNSTEITVYTDVPSNESLLYSQIAVASHQQNDLRVPFASFTGYDCSVDGLSLELAAGQYWLGLNSNTTADYAYGATSWDQTTGNHPALRGRYQTEYLRPESLPGGFYPDEDSVFQIVGFVVPEPSTFVLLAMGAVGIGYGWHRRRRGA